MKAALLIMLIVFSSCTIVGQKAPIGDLKYLGNFYIIREDDFLKGWFSVFDSNGFTTRASGEAFLTIKDKSGRTVYHQKYSVLKEDFASLQEITGEGTGEAYVFKIALDDIAASEFLTGKAYLRFKTADITFPEVETVVFGLPRNQDIESEEIVPFEGCVALRS
ncbi:hypothetical protein D6745_03310 [Candidatus Woesearchaeota archaeon]|nr:MAG: hypothetical protein D6745_03310 [Candidatus Woesearchaeota archaeon]